MKTIVIILSVLVISINNIAQDVNEILDKIQKNERISSSKSYVKQTITTSKGSIRTLEMESYSRNFNESQLSIYKSPARVAGDKILMKNDGDDIWFYTPKTDRIRHLASHAKRQKVQGSDFSYEDFENWDYKKDFIAKLSGKEKIKSSICYKIELVPTETGPHYSKIIVWADVDNYVVRKADYYEDGDFLKTLICEDIEKVGNYWIAKKLVMTNQQDGGSTVMESSNIQFDIDIEDNMFSTNNLSKR